MKVLMIACGVLAAAATGMAARDQEPPLHASDILATLPDGETKRRYILDCTGCHQLHPAIAWPGGQRRNVSDWRLAVTRMLGYAGPNTGFPVISAHAVPDSLARFLATHLPERSSVKPAPRPVTNADIREYMMPVAGDLPHDVAIDEHGSIIITGMFSHRMYVLEPESGALAELAIPVERSGPRAVEIAPDGEWWVLLGGSKQVGAYDPKGRSWRTFDIGVYPHSIALDSTGGAWYNGHFTRDPALIGRIDRAGGDAVAFDAPLHPELAKQPGGPIPLPTPGAMVRHLAVDSKSGDLWIAYGASPGIAARVARLRR